MKKLMLTTLAVLCGMLVFAGKKDKKSVQADSAETAIMKEIEFMDSVQTSMKYQTGEVELEGGMAKLKIPAGFKFLNAEQARFVVNKVWGNPPRPDVLGMIFPAEGSPYSDSSFAFIVTFDEMGYVEDKDADDINYDDMLKEMQAGEAEANKERAALGYEGIHMVGWASKPFYDKEHKVLHWAKELQFEGTEGNTLNYDVRVLGRKGVLSFNAVANVSELGLVKKNIDQVLAMPEFTAGNKYSDYNPDVDKVAAYTVGSLVAGKVLAKVGFFAVIVKFWKLIALAVVGAFAAIKKFIFGKKKEEEPAEYAPAEETTDENTTA